MLLPFEIFADVFLNKVAQTGPATGPVSLDNMQPPLDPAKETAYKQHLARVQEQAKILSSKAQEAVKLNILRPEAQNYVDGLKNLAIEYYNTATATNPDGNKLKDLFKKEVQLYNMITKQYIEYKFDPLKKIRESLNFIGNQGPIKMFEANGAVLPLANSPS